MEKYISLAYLETQKDLPILMNSMVTLIDLYNYEKRGWLDGYVEKIEGKKYIYMRKINGKTVVQHLKNYVFTIDLKDFDADKYLKNLSVS